nr:methyltransferase domain-containing protein [Marinicella sp. W31]MDC2879110.1 methyltransferase domain-containing protein [Marinicella sp. W31]
MNNLSFSSGDLLADRRADFARMLDEAGEFAAAADLMVQALELVPGWPAGLALLSAYQEHAGDIERAIETLEALEKLDAEDVFAAPMKLAVLGAARIPVHPPGRYVEALFDSYAEHFDAALTERLDYRAPQQLASLLLESEGGARYGLAVDLGCGTGLSGEAFYQYAERLEGFDLSQNMLQKAEQKGFYAVLVQADLCWRLKKADFFGGTSLSARRPCDCR